MLLMSENVANMSIIYLYTPISFPMSIDAPYLQMFAFVSRNPGGLRPGLLWMGRLHNV